MTHESSLYPDDGQAEVAELNHVALGSLGPLAATALGVVYSVALGAAMSAGFKQLHENTPFAHPLLQSLSWVLGSSFAVLLAARLAKSRKLGVGFGACIISSFIWLVLLYILGGRLDEPIESAQVFGNSLSVGELVSTLFMLNILFCATAAWFGASIRSNNDPFSAFATIKPSNWLWLWIVGFTWFSIFPYSAYLFWLYIWATLFCMVHPSTWLSGGSDILFGFIGIFLSFYGINISIKALAPGKSAGKSPGLRVLAFIFGTVVLTSIIGPLLVRIDIEKLEAIPRSFGSNPWWLI